MTNSILETRAIDLRVALAETLADMRADIGDDCSASDELDHYDIDETEIGTWFERDRAHVHLYRDTPSGQITIAEWWDDDYHAAVDDGFLTAGTTTLDLDRLHSAAYDYVLSTNPDALNRPSMQITIGSDVNLSDHAIQTGDNSFAGVAYGYPIWAVDTLYRDATDDDVSDLADDLANQLLDQIYDSGEHTYPHLATVSDYDRFVEAHGRGLADVEHVSSGACPGCAECGVPRPTTDTTATASDPLIFYFNALTGARRVPDYAVRGDEFHAHSFDPTSALALEVIDEGFGDLFVYGAEFGPTHIVRASSFDDALDAIYDALPTLDESELPDAYGFYTISDAGTAYLCADPSLLPEHGEPRHFPWFGATHRVICEFEGTYLEAATDYMLDSELGLELDLVEGYYYQSNATGIVAPSPHEWLDPLDRESAVRLRIIIDTDADLDTAGRVEFTHCACDVCNRNLGGERSPMHGIDSNGDTIHFDACPDCVYFAEYGTLDDQTMIDLGID